METNEVQALVPSLSITGLLAQRDAIIGQLEIAAKALEEVAAISNAAFTLATYNCATPTLEDRCRTHARFPEGLEDFKKSVDAAAWDHLLCASGLRTFMDAAARKAWDEDIAKRKVAPLTEANIHATFSGLYDSRAAMFETGVVAVYRSLSWDYKTNLPCKFGKRIIMQYLSDVYGSGKQKYNSGARYEACNKLDDLIRVLKILDKQPEPDHRQSAYQVLRGVRWPNEQAIVEIHGVLSVKGFKNGNGHITFLRPDLIDQINQILAKHHPNALPPKSEEL